MKKRMLSALVASCLIVGSLVGCGDQGNTVKTSNTSNTSNTASTATSGSAANNFSEAVNLQQTPQGENEYNSYYKLDSLVRFCK